MIYLLLSICISSSLYLIFKSFTIFKIDTFQAIVFNYLVAFTCGVLSSEIETNFVEIPQEKWFYGALFLGFLFVTVFNVMALTSQKNGLSVASISSKMSVVIPVLFGVLVYQENLSFIKVGGVLLALVAVYLASVKTKEISIDKKFLLLPILLFFGSGIIDTTIKYFETNYVQEGGIPIFSAAIFMFAFIFGFLFLIFKLIKKETKFQPKSLLGGILLGVPNYYSIYFLLKALQTEGFESSILFTINNVGIVVLTTFFGLFFFKEKLFLKNWVGIILAIVSILLVSISR